MFALPYNTGPFWGLNGFRKCSKKQIKLHPTLECFVWCHAQRKLKGGHSSDNKISIID